jgi:hypothetical protein
VFQDPDRVSLSNSLDILIEFSGHPQANDPRFEAPPHNHVGRGRFTVFNEACEDATNRFLDVPTELFLSSAFADEPFPDLLLAKSFADQLESPFYRVALRRIP